MTTYHHHDALGSVIALTDGTGAVIERYKYDVFGQPTFLAPDGVTVRAESSYGNKFLFTGREWLPLSGGYHLVINYGSSSPPTWQPLPGGNQVGLYDYRNRAYTALLGRFMQTDPIRFDAGDANLYRYVGNRATGARDPMGLADGDLYSLNQVFAARRAAALKRAINARSCYHCHNDPEVMELGLLPFDMPWWNHDLDWVHEVVGIGVVTGFGTVIAVPAATCSASATVAAYGMIESGMYYSAGIGIIAYNAALSHPVIVLNLTNMVQGAASLRTVNDKWKAAGAAIRAACDQITDWFQ